MLGALLRRHGRFDACEDAVQEALLAAATQWPADGVPDNPRGWLIAVANRRLIDHIRSDSARRRREDATAAAMPIEDHHLPAADAERVVERDDTLTLLFLCCHPELSAPSQVALTLRAVGGLTTAEVARAFLVPEATMAQRISRAKQRIRDSGQPVRAAAGLRARRAAARRAARPLPHLQRGLHRQRRAAAPSGRAHAGSHPSHPDAARGCCRTTARSPACSP